MLDTKNLQNNSDTQTSNGINSYAQQRAQEFSLAHINKSGPHTTLQDLGRKGSQHMGFSSGGAADEHAYRWANKLLNNAQSDPAVEIIFGPFDITFHQACTVAITGAQAHVTLNNIPIKLWQTQRIKSGDRLKVASPTAGLINYLAISGGFLTQMFLGSASVVVREKTGTNLGIPFSKNSFLTYQLLSHKKEVKNTIKNYQIARPLQITPSKWVPNYNEPLTLHIFFNSQYTLFNKHAIRRLLSNTFIVDQNSNKMGYKVRGSKIALLNSEQVSEGIGYGAVQIPPDGYPIILLKDRQTIGGYPKIGAISQRDAFKLSQRRAGQSIRFAQGNIQKERQELIKFLHFFTSNSDS